MADRTSRHPREARRPLRPLPHRVRRCRQPPQRALLRAHHPQIIRLARELGSQVSKNEQPELSESVSRYLANVDRDISDIDFVAVNDITDTRTLAHLLKYDSILGNLDHEITAGDDSITVAGDTFKVFAERDPAKIDWESVGAEIVIESTGRFTNAKEAEGHFEGAVSKVVISAPAKGEDITIVLGVNESSYDPEEHDIISNASCTTNCLAPVAKVILDNFGIHRGLMTTVHSITNDQVVLDGPHKDLRRARGASQNIIPTSTGAAKALALVIPELEGKFDGTSLRVPTPTVSIIDFVVETDSEVTPKKVNDAFKAAAESDQLQGILGYTDEPLVSSDFRGDSRSAIVDGQSTMAVSSNLIKVLAWYDNEWAYACRVAELVALIHQLLSPKTRVPLITSSALGLMGSEAPNAPRNSARDGAHGRAIKNATTPGQPETIAPVSSVAAISPSMRSSTPPWPGMILLASFTPNRRFRNDSNRSPMRPVNAITAPTSNHTPSIVVGAANTTPHPSPAAAPASTPLTIPDQVLFGERPVAIFGPPISLPPKYAKMSAAQITANKASTIAKPPGWCRRWRVCPTSSARSRRRRPSRPRASGR